ncbi:MULTISPECIES: HAD family hydrolase [unclassified Streptomyces]|uniref:HAD family hydrolase n=1 Tax=Streptomyces sp. LcepLS TaxID=1839764 RepID=UPI000B804185|nr:HAD hydrolase family protein [Streptomyces sp. SID4945]MYR27354.1 HAD hydrolase family protein [Streptomyces sp. SID4945]
MRFAGGSPHSAPPSVSDRAWPEIPPGPRPRLIATDLDGTLLREDKTVSPRTLAALAAAERAGVTVFFVTGRPARWMDVVAGHVDGHGLAICGNGAAVVDLRTPDRERGVPYRFVRVRPLPSATVLDVAERLRRAAPGTQYAVERTSGIHHEPGYPPLHLDPASSIAPITKLLGLDSGPAPEPEESEPVLKLLAHHPDLAPDAFLRLARDTVGDLVAVTRSSPTALLEISAREVSKASTLAQCCAERGIAPEDVIAFGDMPNDIEMLTWAGRSWAMGNAHPEVRLAASAVTHPNTEDGVAAVIERLLA